MKAIGNFLGVRSSAQSPQETSATKAGREAKARSEKVGAFLEGLAIATSDWNNSGAALANPAVQDLVNEATAGLHRVLSQHPNTHIYVPGGLPDDLTEQIVHLGRLHELPMTVSSHADPVAVARAMLDQEANSTR
ncbi:MAG: hypothetical protein H7255_18175 [Ramlibacter sp.]|nr:hypothetical protein [Ramlibacter sp.]